MTVLNASLCSWLLELSWALHVAQKLCCTNLLTDPLVYSLPTLFSLFRAPLYLHSYSQLLIRLTIVGRNEITPHILPQTICTHLHLSSDPFLWFWINHWCTQLRSIPRLVHYTCLSMEIGGAALFIYPLTCLLLLPVLLNHYHQCQNSLF